MGKDRSNQKNVSSHNSKPYDLSNSFVRKVATRVSGYLGGFFSTPEPERRSPTPPTSSAYLPDLPSTSTQSEAPTSKRLKLSDSSLLSPIPVDQENSGFISSPYRYPERTGREEPIAGPSGLQHHQSSQRTNNESRDDRSESSESTSGCSSLVPQADRMSQSAFASISRRKSLALEDKLSYARQLKQSRSSFYLNRSIPVKVDTPRPSRTPSFDASVYGNAIFNKSNLREAMLSSPFYTGHTTYGGASARRGSLSSLPDRRRQIAVKPARDSSEDLNMSSTARRILAALEEFSTPLSDAKRMPTPSQPLAAKRRSVETSNPAKRPALAVPTVADLLKMRRLEQIQESTAAARQIVGQTKAPTAPVSPLRETSPRRLRKVDKETSSKKHNPKPQENPPEVDLPSVPLPITTLPKFKLEVPAATALPPSLKFPTSKSPATPSFDFAAPNVVNAGQRQSSPPCNLEFKFSDPLAPQDWVKRKREGLQTLNISADAFAKLKRKPEVTHSSGSVLAEPAAELKLGSVMDVLGKGDSIPSLQVPPTALNPVSKAESPKKTASFGFGDKFKPAVGSWSCDACMLTNSAAATKCVACESARPGGNSSAAPQSFCNTCVINDPKKCNCNMCKPLKIFDSSKPASQTSGFGDKFKPEEGSWSCPTCLVNNSASKSKCAACETSKPGKQGATTKNQLGFGDAFKAAPGSWSCKSCLVSNQSSASKCVACETEKPGLVMNGPPSGFGDICKKKQGTWECSVCLIINDESKNKCAACETPHPDNGRKVVNSTSKFNFDLPPESLGFKFGIDKAAEGVSQNGPSAVKTIPTVTQTTPAPFSFGIPATKKQEVVVSSAPPLTKPVAETKTTIASLVTTNSTDTPSSKITFSFGSSQPGPSTIASTPVFGGTLVSSGKPLFASTSAPLTSGFNGTITSKPISFGIKPTPSPFGNSATPAPTPFVTSTPSTSAFGNAFATAPSQSTFSFGGVSSVVNSAIPPSIFKFGAQPAGNATSEVPAFPSQNGPSFSFGTQPSNPFPSQTASSAPSFGQPPLNSALNFGQQPAISSPNFGQQASTPSFGQMPTGFGQPSATGFGQSSAPPAAFSTQFQFGTGAAPFSAGASGNDAPVSFGSNAAAPTSTGFGFSPSAPAAATSNFSLTVPSSFNFTGGQVQTFSAEPSSAPAAPRRKIIRAVRRAPPR